MTTDILISLMLDPMWWSFTYHKRPADPKLAKIWPKQVAKTRGDVFNPSPGAAGTFVSSNHFPLRRRTLKTPKRIIHLLLWQSLIISKNRRQRKGKRISCNRHPDAFCPMSKNHEEMVVDTDYCVSVPMQFEQLTRELEVKVYKGLPSTETFKFYSII